MAVNKVVINTTNGEETLIDLTGDSVTPETLAIGATAHSASGETIYGAMPLIEVVQEAGQSETSVMSQKAVTNYVDNEISELEENKLSTSELNSAIDSALVQAKESGEFDGATGQRGTGLLPVTKAPSSYTTAVGGITPKYRMAISTIKTQAGVTEVLLGDTVRYSYYHYPIAYLDDSYAYFTTRVSIRGATGASMTITSVSESVVDGGINIVTFSDGTTLNIINGSKGSKGDKGEKGDPGATGEAGADGKDGLDATPVTPLFANSIEECTDTTKFYVLPDGFIYAYQYVEATAPSYTNLSETVHENYRMGSGGTLSALTGGVTTDFIPVKKGQKVRFKGFDPTKMPSDKTPYICFYTGASESSKVSSGVWDRLDWMITEGRITQDTHGAWVYTAFMSPENNPTYPCEHPLSSSITHIRLCGAMITGETVIVTVDEEITEGGSTGGYAWVSTGHAFVPADYEAEILALQKNKADKTDIPTKLPNPNVLTIDGVPYDGSAAVNIETQSGGNILYGKKWVACGDSFTENGYNTSDGFDESVYIYQDGRFAGRYKVYPHIIGLRNNMNVVNLATGGQTMANSSNSFMTRYANIDADADYITIMLGINDKIQGISVGAIDSTDKATFCGAFNVAMEHILENHPFAHIGIMVSNGTNEEIMEATRGIAERWGVPYLDYGSPQVPLMNRYTGRNVCAKAQQIREKNFCVISDGTNVTNGHPNTAAHEYESTFIEAWLRTL